MTRLYTWLLILVAICALLLLIIPGFVMRPFVPPGEGDLALAYAIRRVNPVLTLILLAVGIFSITYLWRAPASWIRKTLTAVPFLALAASAFLAWQNPSEWIFHPLAQKGYIEVSKAGQLEDSDMVLGIQMGQQARAYPVSLLAYHHLVNDVMAGQPLVATY